jgi:hypothetical protein
MRDERERESESARERESERDDEMVSGEMDDERRMRCRE